MRVVVERFDESGTLRFQVAGPIAIITIDRPRQRNALTQQMWATIGEWAEELPAKTRVLVVRGSGEEFTAGSDILEFANLTPVEADEAFEVMEHTIHKLESLPVPTVASINGPAFGAGFVLAMACDIRVGTKAASFGMPVGRLGITLQPPFLRRLTQTLGVSRTMDLVYTARTYDAQEALRLGVLNYLADSSNLDAFTISLCRKIIGQSRASLSAVKENIRKVFADADAGHRQWVDSTDFLEGVRAFTQKRQAQF